MVLFLFGKTLVRLFSSPPPHVHPVFYLCFPSWGKGKSTQNNYLEIGSIQRPFRQVYKRRVGRTADPVRTFSTLNRLKL